MQNEILNNQEETIQEEKKSIVLSGKNSNLTGTQLKKKLSETFAAKSQANKDYKSSEGSISKMLKNVAEFGTSYIVELNKKHGTNVNAQFILDCVNNGKEGLNIFLKFETSKETKEASKRAQKIGKTDPVYTFWVALSLIGRYCEANKVKSTK
jgi:hypothetical protein